jgi:hypothetical protein
MAIALHVYIKAKGAADSDPIAVEHVFYGKTEQEADTLRLDHLSHCDYYALAETEDRTQEAIEEIPDVELVSWSDVTEVDEVDTEEEEEEEAGPDQGE